MIVLTGGAGFIGSCILARLNTMGHKDIVVVDHLADDPLKKKNLENKTYRDYLDKADFLKLVLENTIAADADTVIHMGACSSTLVPDPQYYRQNNFEYTRHLARWALQGGRRFIYASSGATYGDGRFGYSDADDVTRKLIPLNDYGRSKQDFDLWVLDNGLNRKFVGLKFFNVFGPNEYHKGQMRSVLLKAYPRVAGEGRMSLFKSYRPEYGDGEQKRDFIYVKDAVDVVMFFLSRPEIGGIFNVGTGLARTWNDVAKSLFAAVGKKPDITYADMPANLRDQYQYFTQADVTRLRQCGYDKPFTPLEEAVRDYAGYLKKGKHL